MRKIVVGKNESAPALIEKISAELAPEITLVIPKNSALKDAMGSFDLIARAAREVDKRITVESVDEDILALARGGGLDASHPLFSQGGGLRPFADILPMAKAESEAQVKITRKKGKKTVNVSVPVESEAASVTLKPNGPDVSFQPQVRVAPSNLRVIAPPLETDQAEISKSSPRSFWSRPKTWLWLTSLLVLIGLALWLITAFFSRVTVTVNFRKTQFQNSDTFLADKTITGTNLDQKTLPAEVFKDRKNTTQLFPASGRAQVSQKAKGEIVIYNAYNSKPQILVATTRFQAPDGKMFRLDSQVTVPGAEVVDGKIIPASVTANVTADVAGPGYNVGPVPKLTIPGFKGTPRYDAFYGNLPQGTSDGFIGERGVPTNQDIAAAKIKTTSILTGSFTENVLASRPADYKILEGASSVAVTKLTVNSNTNAQGNFSVLGEAEYQAIGFRETDLKTILLQVATQNQPGQVFEKIDLTYSNVKPNFTQGTLQFTAAAAGILRPDFSADKFKQSILGLGIGEAQSLTGKLPGLSDAKLSLWPTWLGTVPGDPQRVMIITN